LTLSFVTDQTGRGGDLRFKRLFRIAIENIRYDGGACASAGAQATLSPER